MNPGFLLAALLLRAAAGQAVGKPYFYLQEGAERCFRESVPSNVAMTVSFDNPENPGIPCALTFKDPKKRAVNSREVTSKDSKGKASFLTQTAGEHEVCIECPSTKWHASHRLRWSVSIELGDSEVPSQDAAKASDMTSLELQLKVVLNRIQVLAAENDYERIEEDKFSHVASQIHSRVLWFAALQVSLIVIATLVSIFHLTRFFRSQKLLV